MYDFLRQQASELRAGLIDIFSFGKSFDGVHGCLLEFDPYWVGWFLLQHSEAYWRREHRWREHWLREAEYEMLMRGLYGYYPEVTHDSLANVPPGWDEHCRFMGYPKGSPPLVIRVLLDSRQKRERGDHQPRKRDQRSEGFNAPESFQGYPLRYSVRPRAQGSTAVDMLSRMARAFGVYEPSLDAPYQIRRRDRSKHFGTLGGLLYANSGRDVYGFSCAHVVGDVGMRVAVSSKSTNHDDELDARVICAKMPAVNLPMSPCSLSSQPNAGRVDVGLVQFDRDVPASVSQRFRIDAIRPAKSMMQGQRLRFDGAVSGSRSGTLGSCTIWQQIKFRDGSDRCYGELFEVVGQGDREFAQQGDSGSAVFDDDGNGNDVSRLNTWAGILVAVAVDRAYFCFADYVLDTLRQETGIDMATR